MESRFAWILMQKADINSRQRYQSCNSAEGSQTPKLWDWLQSIFISIFQTEIFQFVLAWSTKFEQNSIPYFKGQNVGCNFQMVQILQR